MARNKRVTAPEVEEEVVSGDEVTVAWRLGTRVFSKKIHGTRFVDVAKQFAHKHGGKLV